MKENPKWAIDQSICKFKLLNITEAGLLLITIFCLFISLILASGCSKDNETPNPTPQPKAIISEWNQVTTYSKLSISGRPDLYFAEIPAPELTESLIDNGRILFYIKVINMINQTVITYHLDTYKNGVNTIGASGKFEPGSITVEANYNPVATNKIKYQFQYFILPEGIKIPASVDFEDYNATVKFLGYKTTGIK